jgi:hypothetical protein
MIQKIHPYNRDLLYYLCSKYGGGEKISSGISFYDILTSRYSFASLLNAWFQGGKDYIYYEIERSLKNKVKSKLSEKTIDDKFASFYKLVENASNEYYGIENNDMGE